MAAQCGSRSSWPVANSPSNLVASGPVGFPAVGLGAIWVNIRIMENQMEKNMENEMETGAWGYISPSSL